MQGNNEKTVIQLKNKTLILNIRDFGGEIDTEELLQVDLNNIAMDIITFPVLFNRIANIKADMDGLLAETKFDFQVFEAQLYEQHKKKILGDGDKATEKSVEMSILRDPQFKAKKLELLKVQKQADIIDGLYWSAKSKDNKLDKMSSKLTPEDFEKEILEGEINSVMIRVQKSMFKER